MTAILRITGVIRVVTALLYRTLQLEMLPLCVKILNYDYIPRC